MKKSVKIILIIVVIIVILSFIMSYFIMPSRVNSKHQICETDNDCVHVMTKCSCDCGTAVNKEYQKFYEDKIDITCLSPWRKMCDVICNKEISCKDNKCIYFGEFDACIQDSDCQEIDCSIYDKEGLLEGYEPYCIESECHCECRGCE